MSETELVNLLFLLSFSLYGNKEQAKKALLRALGFGIVREEGLIKNSSKNGVNLTSKISQYEQAILRNEVSFFEKILLEDFNSKKTENNLYNDSIANKKDPKFQEFFKLNVEQRLVLIKKFNSKLNSIFSNLDSSQSIETIIRYGQMLELDSFLKNAEDLRNIGLKSGCIRTRNLLTSYLSRKNIFNVIEHTSVCDSCSSEFKDIELAMHAIESSVPQASLSQAEVREVFDLLEGKSEDLAWIAFDKFSSFIKRAAESIQKNLN